MNLYDEEQIRKTIEALKPNGQLFEVRMLEGSKTYSGYFTDADTLITALKGEDLRKRNVYITLNEIDNGCYGRVQRDRFVKIFKEPTTGDKDIVGYSWLMIDLDPRRPSGTSSSDAELGYAKAMGNKIYLSLKNLGFERPITAYSGNGVHLLYKVHIANTDETKELVKKCLSVLSSMFSDERVEVDTKNFNPARITKLYGTVAAKGSNTKDRPHRMSHIIGDAETCHNVKATDIAYLRKLAALIPDEPEKPQRYNNYNPSTFDVEEWMNRYGIAYKAVSVGDGTKYVLDHCPFNENHKGKDAVVFRRSNGALSFVCLHSSCSDKHWKDFRQHFEPNAYERKWREQEQKMYYQFNRNRQELVQKDPVEETEDEPVFLSPKMILKRKAPEATFIRTGITVIDKKMRGLKKGHVSVWSGLRASGKSSVLSQIALYAREKGNNVAFYSGELTERNFMDWMNLQAAGKGYVEPAQYEGFYNTPKQYQEQIAEWLEDHLWLYNNKYGNNYKEVMARFEQIIVSNKLDMLVLDNLMAFDISDLARDKWSAQTAFVWDLTQIAKKYNIHLAFVAHPKKAYGFLRFDDIAGTADLGNAVDDAFIVHRNNNDFKRLSAEMFGWKEDDEIYDGTNVIEIVKDRDGGAQDVFVPLYYEVESKRLKNDPSENIIFGWHEPVLEDFIPLPQEGGDNPFD